MNHIYTNHIFIPHILATGIPIWIYETSIGDSPSVAKMWILGGPRGSMDLFAAPGRVAFFSMAHAASSQCNSDS